MYYTYLHTRLTLTFNELDHRMKEERENAYNADDDIHNCSVFAVCTTVCMCACTDNLRIKNILADIFSNKYIYGSMCVWCPQILYLHPFTNLYSLQQSTIYIQVPSTSKRMHATYLSICTYLTSLVYRLHSLHHLPILLLAYTILLALK